ncbi:adenylate cyclase associated N terminal-domain-containing protein [Baffinella frigidus]|nr:adenylate cyclase associated N terminal-domain-containing protein [Cryptophyta sp. CCMP2293]
MAAVEARLAALEGGKPGTPAAAAAAGGAAAAPFVKAFDELVAEFFAPVEQGAKVCGPDVEKSVAAFKEALAAQRDMLVVASSSRQPFDVNLQKVLKPTSDLMGKVDTLKDRRSKQFNHLAMLAEGVQCLGWVCVEKTPISFLSDTMPGSEMYGNKVVMEFKNTDDAAQADFAKAFKQFLLELQKYVKAHHTTGLAWNPNGGTGFFNAPAKPAAGGGAGGLFAELNALGAAGASATANLKKVQKDQMTHKNPALRASSLVADMSKPAPAAPAGAKAPAAKKAPKFSQNGSKFFIEHYEAPAAKTAPKFSQNGSKCFIEHFEVDDRTLSVTECTNKTAVCMVACNP